MEPIRDPIPKKTFTRIKVPPNTKRMRSFVWNHCTKLLTNRIECIYCGQTYNNTDSNTSAMRKHLSTVHSDKLPDEDKLPYERKCAYAKCQFCDKEFYNNAVRKKEVHEIRYHTKKYTFVCQHCGKGFASSDNHIIHERIHTGVKPYKCNFCKKSFSSKYSK